MTEKKQRPDGVGPSVTRSVEIKLPASMSVREARELLRTASRSLRDVEDPAEEYVRGMNSALERLWRKHRDGT